MIYLFGIKVITFLICVKLAKRLEYFGVMYSSWSEIRKKKKLANSYLYSKSDEVGNALVKLCFSYSMHFF